MVNPLKISISSAQTPKSFTMKFDYYHNRRSGNWLAKIAVSLLLPSFPQDAISHEPLTAEQVAAMKQEGTFEERIQRARRVAPEKIGAGLGPNATYKMRKEAMRARGMSPADISRSLFGGRALAFPYAARPELKASGTVKTLAV